MIAKRNLTQKYADWNNKWGSPYGYIYSKLSLNSLTAKILNIIDKDFRTNHTVYALKAKGPFSIQTNSTTRFFEYPWAYEVGLPIKSQAILDIGGGFGGFQFVLSKSGANVTNVDPGDKEYSWKYTQEFHKKMNRAFGTNVKLVQKTLDKAKIATSSIDTVFCISVIEHLRPAERKTLLKEINRVLKQGGRLILTVDLFLDVFPFTNKKTNIWGGNTKISDLQNESKMQLFIGNKKELYGYPLFNHKKILEKLFQYMINAKYPVLSQLVVFKK